MLTHKITKKKQQQQQTNSSTKQHAPNLNIYYALQVGLCIFVRYNFWKDLFGVSADVRLVSPVPFIVPHQKRNIW